RFRRPATGRRGPRRRSPRHRPATRTALCHRRYDADGAFVLCRQQARFERRHQTCAGHRPALPGLPVGPRCHPCCRKGLIVTAPHPAFALPQRTVLEGRFCRLEPLAAAHVPALYAATADEGEAERYRWLFEAPPANEAALADWVAHAATLEDPLHFAVIDLATGRAAGRQALMRMVPAHGNIEIGSVLWGRGVARTRLATEALYLFARHAFETLGNRRFEWKTNN